MGRQSRELFRAPGDMRVGASQVRLLRGGAASEGCARTPGGVRHCPGCKHCTAPTERQSLAGHEGLCPAAVVACPNAECDEQIKRADVDAHRAECGHEEVDCVLTDCDARLSRQEMFAHLSDSRVGRHRMQPERAKQLVSNCNENGLLKRDNGELNRCAALEKGGGD